jgi:hypothetical protein
MVEWDYTSEAAGGRVTGDTDGGRMGTRDLETEVRNLVVGQFADLDHRGHGLAQRKTAETKTLGLSGSWVQSSLES